MKQKTILIVDDDPYVRLGLTVRLKANRYDVVAAGDGAAAVAQAKEHSPDLIILDLGLPGEDGFTVLENLKASDGISTIPVIVVSGRDRNASREKAMTSGAQNYLQKPVDNIQLLSAIEQALIGPELESKASLSS